MVIDEQLMSCEFKFILNITAWSPICYNEINFLSVNEEQTHDYNDYMLK
jgi:hypothetical protein